MSTIIGVISDTHGLVRPEAVAALRGVTAILHAGDIGRSAVLDELNGIAPVTAIRGNIDTDEWAAKLPERTSVKFEDISVYMLHDLKELDLVPEKAGIDVVISGHSHKPNIVERSGVLFLNPGSAGPRRFKLPVCLAYLEIEGKTSRGRIIELL